MRITGTVPSSVILNQTMKFKKLKSDKPSCWDQEKKEEIWLSPVTKTPTPTEQSKKQRDNIKTPPKTLIT